MENRCMKATVSCLSAVLVAIAASERAAADPARRRDAIVEVVQKVSPAVVYIGTEHIIESRRGPDRLFEEFFGIGRERRHARI
jgi:serine protease Do